MHEHYIEITSTKKIFLDRECWNCGNQWSPEDETWFDDNGVCELCNDTKYIPTVNGAEILEFLNRHRG